MKEILLVGFGGFMGTVGRYLLSLSPLKWQALTIPTNTLVINLLGSLLIGLLAGFLSKYSDKNIHLLMVTGFCGGFTTFSTFSMEGIKLLKSGDYFPYTVYLLVSVLGGLLLCISGLFIAHKLVQ